MSMTSAQTSTHHPNGASTSKADDRINPVEAIKRPRRNLNSLTGFKSYFKLKWNSVYIYKKYRISKQNQVCREKFKEKIAGKLDSLTLEDVVAMQEDDLKVSPFSSRSSSPPATDHSSLWETFGETDEETK